MRRLVLLAVEGEQEPDERSPPLTGRNRGRLLAAERQHAEAVPVACRNVAQRECDPLSNVGLAPVGRAERHGDRRVENDPAHEHALGELHTHVRLAGARRHVPVDVADVVVPRHVGTHLCELRAAAEDVRAMVAGEQALHAAHDRQVERPEELVGKWARARPRRSVLRGGQGGPAHRPFSGL